jgi:hypothetical protein
LNVGTLFAQERFYRIPSYQRPFSWDDEQFDDLILDTKDADRNAPYFIGTMVLHKEADGTLAVVDGQQRLTSLLILLACLRDAIEDPQYKNGIQDKIMQQKRVIDGIPERVRVEVKDRAVFHKVVVETGGTLTKLDEKDLTAPQRRYFIAAQIFHNRISGLNQQQKQDLVTFITQKCVLISLLADSFEQAFRLFEIVNDRGKQLRRIDVLKSINISPDVITQETVRSRVAQKWEETEEEVGEDTFEAIFFLIRLILLKDKPQADLLSEFQNRIFAKGLAKKGEPFAGLLFEYAALYREIFLDKTYLDSDEKFGIRYQSLIHIMDQEFRASEWRACVLQFAKKFGRENLYQFCLAIEKLFLTQWVRGIRKDERYEEYVKVLIAIDTEKDPDKIIKSVPLDAKAIIEAVTRNNLYNAGFCKYALLRLELITSEHDVPKFFSAKSIEHVYPQTPKSGSKWLKGVNPTDVDGFVHKVGNLVLISKSRNSSANNYEFDEKKSKYLKPRVTDYPRSVQVLGYNEWTKSVIDDRTNEVAKIFLNDF